MIDWLLLEGLAWLDDVWPGDRFYVAGRVVEYTGADEWRLVPRQVDT